MTRALAKAVLIGGVLYSPGDQVPDDVADKITADVWADDTYTEAGDPNQVPGQVQTDPAGQPDNRATQGNPEQSPAPAEVDLSDLDTVEITDWVGASYAEYRDRVDRALAVVEERADAGDLVAAAVVETLRAAAGVGDPDAAGDPDGAGGGSDESGQSGPVVIDYSDWKGPQLKDEIAKRNASREQDGRIVPDGSKNADMIAALKADDAR